MSIWEDAQRVKELAIAVLLALVVGFGIGRRRYIGKMPRH